MKQQEMIGSPLKRNLLPTNDNDALPIQAELQTPLAVNVHYRNLLNAMRSFFINGSKMFCIKALDRLNCQC